MNNLQFRPRQSPAALRRACLQ